jgi:hypothetical protein
MLSAGAASARERQPDMKCGFRHDPMAFVRDSRTVEAALVRRHVFRKPLPGDAAVLHRRVRQILADQKPDGHLADGSLLDWAEAPFAGRCDGLAWDGQRLWALDAKARRICVLERSQGSGT